MMNFELVKEPRPVWTGGPPAVCSVCKFRHQYPWYVVFNSVFGELNFETSSGEHVFEENIHLCSDHALELKAMLDSSFPDERITTLQAKLFQAEAARAAAERKMEKAEAALHAMQDWVSETPADLPKPSTATPR